MGLFSRKKTTPASPWLGLVEDQDRREAPAPDGSVPEVAPEPVEASPEDAPATRGGRPVVAEPRTKRVSMSLTEAEHAAWVEAAGQQRLSVWAREQVQAQLAQEQPSAGKAAELARIRADLARVGSNLNQLMRATNQGQVPKSPELVEAVNRLWQELVLVRRDLP